MRFYSFRCFAMDRSGVVVIHKKFLNKDFFESNPMSQIHVTKMEPDIAADMVNTRRLTADSCVSYEDITNQLFWKVYEYDH